MRLLAEPCCATNQLTDALARIPLPDLGVQLVIAQSLCEGAGNGLFAALLDGTAEATLPAGTPLCGLAEGAFADAAEGDSAVPFAFTDLEQLVLHDGDLAPLERPLRAAADSTLYGHRVLRYGPNDSGLMISAAPGPDLPNVPSMFVPSARPTDLPAAAWRMQAGQFSNDLAFAGFDALDGKGAYWEYEQASAERNLLSLFWSLALDASSNEWRPERVWSVVTEDVRIGAAGVAHELGTSYGIEYWRRRAIGR